jgi:hypothetical protein
LKAHPGDRSSSLIHPTLYPARTKPSLYTSHKQPDGFDPTPQQYCVQVHAVAARKTAARPPNPKHDGASSGAAVDICAGTPHPDQEPVRSG